MEAISKHKAVCHAEPVGLHWMIGPIINIPNIACTVKCFLEPIWNEDLQAFKDIFHERVLAATKLLKLESQLRTALTIVKIRNSVLGRHGVACRRAEAYQSQELPSYLIGQTIASELCFLRHRLLQLQIFRRDVTSASSTLLLATAVASNTRSP